MKEHISMCKSYRAAYKEKLSSKTVNEALKEKLRRCEDQLDDVNIRIQRQLAEREVKKAVKEKEKSKEQAGGGGGFMGWLWGSKSAGSANDSTTLSKTVKKLEEAMSTEEKQQLFDAIDYQENAGLGIYPKSFVARRLFFKLARLTVAIRDDDLKNSEILKLTLKEVSRPSLSLSRSRRGTNITRNKVARSQPPTPMNKYKLDCCEHLQTFSYCRDNARIE